MNRLRLLSFLGIVAFAFSCTAPPPPPPRAQQVEYLQDPPEEFPVVPGVAAADDVARFLAGKPVRAGAILSRLQQTAEYQAHQAEMRRVWRTTARARVNRMSQWSYANLSSHPGGSGVVFYPFGGPDLLHAAAMFPQVPRHVLVGLEPVGDVPGLEGMNPADVLATLPAFREATRTQLRTGYFITKDMRADLERSALRGVTPILLSTISLMDGRVQSVQPVSAAGRPGVEIRWLTGGGAVRTSVYVSGDLSNSGFNSGFRGWLAGFGRGAAYLKAASYLPHDDRFSQVRDFVLSQADVIVQDDSGIPLRFFDSARWRIDYHGSYDGPIDLFAKHLQADLRAAYAVHPAPPLPFGSGYHWNPASANLIVAVRR